MTSEYSKENEKILRELLEKLKQYFNAAWTIKNIVYTLDDIPEFLEMIDYLDSNQNLTKIDIKNKAIDIAYNSYKGERE